MSGRPRILMVAPAAPADHGGGLAMRLGLFLEACAEIGRTDLAVIPASGAWDAGRVFVQRLGVRELPLGRLAPETMYRLLSRLRDPAQRLAAFRAYGRPSLAAWVTPQLRANLAQLIAGKYDLVHVSRLYLAESVERTAAPRLTLDLDEDDASSCLSEASLAPAGAVAAEWMRIEAEAFERMLGAHATRYDKLWTASPRDAAAIQARHPALDVACLPNAVVLPAAAGAGEKDSQDILFVGTLGYKPNEDGIAWFVREVWPRVRSVMSRSRLLIVGGGAGPLLRALAADDASITSAGFVEDLEPFYRKAALAIAPMRSGGGTRIKVLEAAAFAVPCVATSASLSGLDLPPDACWRADTAGDFASACIAALSSRELRGKRGREARRLVAERYDRGTVIKRLVHQFREALG